MTAPARMPGGAAADAASLENIFRSSTVAAASRIAWVVNSSMESLRHHFGRERCENCELTRDELRTRNEQRLAQWDGRAFWDPVAGGVAPVGS